MKANSASTPRSIVGIDLGTTFSLVAVMNAGRPMLIPNVLGEVLTPSAVSVDDDGQLLVGSAARARRATHPHSTALNFKRDMGTDRKIALGRQQRSPEELSAYVLRALKADAEAYLGHPVEEAVITVPAYFGELQREATRVAGEIAGLRVERIINEPTAAALAYGLHHIASELRAVVLDLGGGTFDVTVLEIMEGVIEIRSTAGDSRLGGEDFSEALAREVVRRLTAEGKAPADDAVTLARIQEAAEVTKRRLSEVTRARWVVAGLALQGGGQADVELLISREEAERAFAPLIARATGPIQRALRDAGLGPHDIDEVLLVGGSTRLPCVADLCSELFGRLPKRDLPPDESVALGAAVQAALKAGDSAVDDLVVTDVAPFSMGIASTALIEGRLIEGMFAPILERGTVIPASRVESFTTVANNQTFIEIQVFQGEHAMCQSNVPLGSYKVKVRPAPAGKEEVEVRFTYDLNGLLEVETTVVATGATRHLVVERKPGSLTQREIDAARAAMGKIKFHPRESLPNRTALSRADALFVELRGAPRAELSAALAAFRSALDRQDPATITKAREALTGLVEQLR